VAHPASKTAPKAKRSSFNVTPCFLEERKFSWFLMKRLVIEK